MTVKNSLVKSEKEKSVVKFVVDSQEVKLSPDIIRKYLVNGNGNVTDQEINYFIQLCKARQLNPHVKDAYLIKFGNQPATMVVAKDVLERRAIKHPQYNGKKYGIYVLTENGELIKRDHSILLDNEELVGAWCEVYRKDWEYPAKVDVNLKEYIGRKSDGTPNTNWTNKPVTMITKVAKAQALREAFIEELGGMYDSSEIPNSEEIINNTVDYTEDDKEKEINEFISNAKNEAIQKAIEMENDNSADVDEDISEIFGK